MEATNITSNTEVNQIENANQNREYRNKHYYRGRGRAGFNKNV